MINDLIKKDIDDIGFAATELQKKASDPSWNIWVNASAGTGKTKVLTDRVLRLLLPTAEHSGTDPQNILCLTFTKAGANEMITRVMRILSYWAVCPQSELLELLEKLLGHAPSLKQIDKARQLFAQVVDSPEGLNITTIHAFCQSVLGRFTLEAGLPTNFKVMEESESTQIIKQTRNELIKLCVNAQAEQDVRVAFKYLSRLKNADQVNKIFQSIFSDRQSIITFLKNNDDVHAKIYKELNLDIDDDETTIFKHYFSDANYPKSKIEKIATALNHGTSKTKEKAKRIQAFCSTAMHRNHLYDEYKSIFITNDGNIRKLATKASREFDPSVDDLINEEGHRILKYMDHINSYYIAQSTNHLIVIARDIMERYKRHKELSHKLDYDDLIEKTQILLNSEMRDWVLYKLDYQLDHILVDEAQDTSPQQWAIIKSLLGDFFSGENARDTNVDRTVFVVGDKKQSIFSFQGASPKVFSDVQTLIQKDIQHIERKFDNIPMNTSFRSTTAILDAVDHVFTDDDMKISVAGSIHAYNKHTSYRQGQSGRVEIWPLYKSPKTDEAPAWKLPTEIIENKDAQAALANRIAQEISDWIEKKHVLKSKNKPIQAGDIMILVRRRNAMVEHLIRALKSYKIPVSGADRLIVTNHIAVKDVLCLIDFALMPDNDLTLATLLKSPFIGWDDNKLETFAYNRDDTLWNIIKNSDELNVIQWLKDTIKNLAGNNAFSSISDILNLKTPNNNMTGWQCMLARLGMDSIDPLEELLTMAQHYDSQTPAGGLQGFLKMAQSNKADIKRELETASNMVRIMTVHASKGLQAPIVVLPDTVSTPQASGKSEDGFQWINDDYPLWSPSTNIQNDILKSNKEKLNANADAEYNRLLYVAMTRAEDQLIVCGTLNKNQQTPPEKSWYMSVVNGLKTMDIQSKNWEHDGEYLTDTTQTLIYETNQLIDVASQKLNETHFAKTKLPQWLSSKLNVEHSPPKILRPSQDDSTQSIPVRSPLTQTDDTYRFRRGNLTHALLQYLPNLDISKRESAGIAYLDKQATSISNDIKNSILSETLTILNDPQFESFFSTNSMAEVPVTGVIKNSNGTSDIVSGQIDRLLVTDDCVWIVDFKSNRPPPKDIKNVPLQYWNQLKSYKTLMADIYPNHNIRCALLWTDGPHIMELDID